jgi:hypothetical protein
MCRLAKLPVFEDAATISYAVTPRRVPTRETAERRARTSPMPTESAHDATAAIIATCTVRGPYSKRRCISSSSAIAIVTVDTNDASALHAHAAHRHRPPRAVTMNRD